MLDGAGDEVPASGDFHRLGDAADRKIVRLRAAAREDDFRDLGSEKIGNRRPGIVEHAFGPLTEMVDA